MKLFLHELSDTETVLDYTEKDAWVLQTVEKADEQECPAPSSRPVELHFSVRKVDDVIVLSGDLNTRISLMCSRCATPFSFACDQSFSGLYSRDPATAGVAHLEEGSTKPAGQNKGFARHAHDFGGKEREHEFKFVDQDLDITYLPHDYLDLSEVLLEQIQVLVPFQPLCKESCKGICPQCGADQNQGKCGCKAISSNPFSALQNLKL